MEWTRKATLTFLLNENEDYEFRCALNGKNLNLDIYEALQAIRNRLKYGEDVSEKEQETLENIRSILSEHYIEG